MFARYEQRLVAPPPTLQGVSLHHAVGESVRTARATIIGSGHWPPPIQGAQPWSPSAEGEIIPAFLFCELFSLRLRLTKKKVEFEVLMRSRRHSKT